MDSRQAHIPHSVCAGLDQGMKVKRGTPDHPKVAHLAALLNIEIFSAVGILEMLWHFTAKFAPCGDIGKHSDAAIAEAVHWRVRSGSAGVATGVRLRSALVEAGFLDTCLCHRLVVHDWPDHADQSVTRMMTRQKLVFVHTSTSLPLPLPEPQPEHSHRRTANGGTDFEAWFELQYSRHPNKREKTPSARLAAEAFAAGKFTLKDFDRRHAAWCATEAWTWKSGAKAPRSLGEWITDEGYRYDPPAGKPPESVGIPAEYSDPNRYKLGD